MQVLKSNRTFFKRIHLLSSKEFPITWRNVKVWLLVSIELFLVLPAMVYFVANIRNLLKATDSMGAITAFSISFGMHCHILANQHSLEKLLAELQEIVNLRTNRSSFKTYADIQAKITKFTATFTIVITGMCSMVLLMPLIVAAIFWLIGDLNESRFFLPFKVTFPFDVATPAGFLAGALIQLIVGWKFCAIFCAINTFYIGVCWYAETSFNDIQTFFDEIESHLMAQDHDDRLGGSIIRFALKRSLVEAVDFHVRILRFIEHFAHLMDGVIFLTFSIGTIWLSSMLAQYMDITLKIFIPTVSNILILVWLFVYCYYGHLISSKSEQVAEFAYNSKFYLYPLDLRIFTTFMILRSQRPFFITGYRITRCSLESYGRFVNVAVSVFMLFRNLSK